MVQPILRKACYDLTMYAMAIFRSTLRNSAWSDVRLFIQNCPNWRTAWGNIWRTLSCEYIFRRQDPRNYTASTGKPVVGLLSISYMKFIGSCRDYNGQAGLLPFSGQDLSHRYFYCHCVGGEEVRGEHPWTRFRHLPIYYTKLICESIDVENYSKNLDYSW